MQWRIYEGRNDDTQNTDTGDWAGGCTDKTGHVTAGSSYEEADAKSDNDTADNECPHKSRTDVNGTYEGVETNNEAN